MSSADFTRAREMVDEHKIEYGVLRPPLRHDVNRGVILDENNAELNFDKLGVCYLHEHIKTIPYADFSDMYYTNDLGRICTAVNAQIKQPLVTAKYDGKIVGVMTEYHPVPHAVILNTVDNYELVNMFTSPYINRQVFGFNLALESTSIDDTTGRPSVVVSLRIVNGHSGHVAFKLSPYVSVSNFEWVGSQQQFRSRHFASTDVGAIYDRIRLNLGAVRSMAILSTLSEMTSSFAVSVIHTHFAERKLQMTRNQLQILAFVESDPTVSTGLDIMTNIGVFSGDKGQGAAVNGLLKPLLDRVFNK